MKITANDLLDIIKNEINEDYEFYKECYNKENDLTWKLYYTGCKNSCESISKVLKLIEIQVLPLIKND